MCVIENSSLLSDVQKSSNKHNCFIENIEYRVILTEQRENEWIVIQFDLFLIFGQGSAQIAFHFQRLGEIPMRVIKSRIQVDCFVQLFDRFIIASGYQVVGTKIGGDNDRQRIELEGMLPFRNRAIKLPHGQQ